MTLRVLPTRRCSRRSRKLGYEKETQIHQEDQRGEAEPYQLRERHSGLESLAEDDGLSLPMCVDMSSPILFVGEKRSAKAIELGLRWEHGGLAAKPLFEALCACDIDPAKCVFTNIFERGGRKKAQTHHGLVVAMGQKAAKELSRMQVEHISIVHPAARGKIRKRARYVAHVKSALSGSFESSGGVQEHDEVMAAIGHPND
jgi:hypothetical protein